MKSLLPLAVIVFLFVSCPNAGTVIPHETEEPELSPPSELLISADGNRSFLLEWTFSSEEEIDGFYLQRSTSEDFASPDNFEITDINARTHTDSDLAVGDYYYRIQAFKVKEDSSLKYSSWSNTANGEITETPQAPTAPELTGCTALGIFDIEITWNDNSSNEDGFNIQYVDKEEYNTNGFNGTPSSESADTNHVSNIITASDTDKIWYVRIAAYNDVGSSDWSAPMSVELTSVPADPTNFTASAESNTSIALAWNYDSFIEDEFLIQYDTESDFSSGNTPVSVNKDNRTYSLTGLENGTYYVRIAASNSLSSSNWVEADNSVLLQDPHAPNPPSNFTAERVEEYTDTYEAGEAVSILLKWTDSSNETEYILQRSTTSSFASYTSFTLPENTDVYIDSSTAGSTEYFYRLYASNGSSLSSALTSSGVTTDANSGQKVLHIYRRGQNSGSGPGGHIVYNIWISNGTEYKSVFKSENYGFRLKYWTDTILSYFNNSIGNTDQIDATTGPTESGRFNHTTAEDYTHSLILDGSMGNEFDVYYETDRSWEHNDWFESTEGPSLIYKAHVDLNSYSEPIIFDLLGFYDSSQPDHINYETRYITHHDADGTHEFGDGNTHTFGNYDEDNPAILFVYPFTGSDNANYATGNKYLIAAIHQ